MSSAWKGSPTTAATRPRAPHTRYGEGLDSVVSPSFEEGEAKTEFFLATPIVTVGGEFVSEAAPMVTVQKKRSPAAGY